jgi:hypothetical protein
MIESRRALTVKNKESEKRQYTEMKTRWETPRIFELDFAETRQTKEGVGEDGPNFTPGTFKWTS